ncbi:hypothetical protein COW53_00720 [bacterium CG17_big_fil_post_rev_8_21_14_2_50_64_8]|nr:MAG: hypothetical protein COW53_00720 [bacterium CG17_big_fil_post_rev_8_21_14_2_50_64_8]PJA74268.1 MAG: hypothetical protein CO151_10230 [bacterium CG_4_9_14_3_um_filter_65_15]
MVADIQYHHRLLGQLLVSSLENSGNGTSMIGKRILHYEITAQIGKGGMGEVYSARDTKLGRDVALKILPAELSGDSEREARFQIEARALASLQHPNVASVYGFEEVEGTRFLVMELIKGRDLTARMAEGPSTVEDTRRIARQMAAGLEAAHERGIVHRDLKPGNIMETDEGEVKILDFGLAQAWFGDGEAKRDSGSLPTMTAALTQIGTILGTAAYMSPEQARGASLDRRTDIWAYGVILFEMLTGRQLFQGETVSDTLAAVLRAEPTWDDLPVDQAPELCHLIERCLDRDPRQRLRDIGEARIFLQEGGASSSSLSFSRLGMAPMQGDASRKRPPVALMVVLALACVLGGTLLGWKVLGKPEPRRVLHTMLPPPPHTDYDLKSTAPGPAVPSPDGTMVTFTAVDEGGTTLLYLRHLNQGESVSMPGTESANYPFWSPDNRFIGFFDEAGKKMKKVAVRGGPPVTICPSENGKGGSWNTSGQIIFAPSYNSGIFVVPEIGGTPQQLTTLGAGYDSHRHPRFMPDGRHFLFVARVQATGNDNDIFLASLDTTEAPRMIAQSEANADFNHRSLLTVREGVLMATPFDTSQERAIPGGTPLVENILTLDGAEISVFGVSQSGMMTYQTGASSLAQKQLAWMDTETGVEEPVGEPGQLSLARISPDGKRAVVVVEGASNEGQDLWLVDLETGLRTRFTFLPGDENAALWSPDGRSIFYTAKPDSQFRILEQPVEGMGGTAVLLESALAVFPSSVSPDGKMILLDRAREDANMEMVRLDLDAAAGEPVVVGSAPDNSVGGGIYSPDGRWIAYHATTAAGWDVFVMPAGGGARKWQVTSDGAVYPQWDSHGKHLWVIRFAGDLRRYDVDGTGQTFRVGKSKEAVRVEQPGSSGSPFDLDPAGKRLLHAGTDPVFRAEVSYLHLVTDWQRGLAR